MKGGEVIKQRVERHVINKNHKMFNICDDYCFKSKNLYNYANYIVRQEFINNDNFIKYVDLSKMLNQHETFKDMGSNSAQMTLRLLEKDWKSFFISIKDWSKNKTKYLGKPKLPRYKNKNGRHITMFTNRQTRIENGYLFFAFKPFKPFNNLIKTNINGRLLQTRIIPSGGCYTLEIVYEVGRVELKGDNARYIGIDLGLNNFATIANNIGEKSIVINGRGVKSYNQYWNKQVSHYRSLAKKNNNINWSKRLQNLTDKRENKINHFLHCVSRYIINYCLEKDVSTIVIGYNKKWKQDINLGRITQDFMQIPYYKFIEKLKYKCEDVGINLEITEESYTSGTSFLDNELPIKENYNKSRRVKRGLSKSDNNILINADVNASYQIIRKVFPNAFSNGIEGVCLHPVMVNI